ncbi:PAS domain S-box protein [Microvirga sp. VF16]|uniref:PAS domain S-box protein n=1 Tax=Microvirga sp. VF16 TaxID=2807101 RepID=UPI00193EC062|nr:PAS domain S-box protein [Microvirga sp. VF16]QRM34321.1 PAS domain S-box protein [Microvirga sp. VF16]
MSVPAPGLTLRWFARPLILAVAVFLTLFGATGFLRLQYWHERQAADLSLEHSRQVLDTLDRLRTIIANPEAERRGYLLTLDPAYLKAYEVSDDSVRREAQALQALVANDPLQNLRAEHLAPTVLATLHEIDDIVKTPHVSGLVALAMIRNMDEIRSQVDQMADHERFLLADWKTRATTLEQHKTWLIAAAAVSVTVLAGTALALARLEARRRRKATEENVRLHSDLERREKKIRRLVDANIIGIVIWDLEGRILEANDAFLRIIGYDREDLVAGRIRWTDLTPLEWRERDVRLTQEVKRTGSLQPYEKVYFRKDGSRVPVLIGAATFEEGANQGVAFVLDLTERKRAEEELQRSEAYLAEAESLSKSGSWAWNPATKAIIYWSQERYRLFGFDPKAGIPSFEALLQRIHPEDRGKWLANTETAIRIRGDSETDFRIVLPDGEIKHLHGIGHPVFSEPGDLLEIIGAAMDVTERKQAEEALRASEERFRTLVQFSFDVYWETDAQHRFIRQEFAEDLADAPAPGSEIGKTRWEVPYVEPDEEGWRKHRETLDAHLPFRDFELARPTPDGGKRYVSVSGLPVFDQTGRFIGYRGVGRHITERKQAEEALRESEEKWKAVFESNPTMYFMVDAAGTTLSVNAFGAEQLGYTPDELVGSPVLNVFHEPDREAVQRLVARCFAQPNRAMSWEARKVRKDGTVLWVRETARSVLLKNCPVILVACEDITERKRAEEALQKAQAELAHVTRVTTIGELTSSIAHEVNQPLAAIVTNANAALRWLASQPPNLAEVRATLERIVQDGHRAGAVIGRARALFRKTATITTRVDLNELIRDTVALVQGEVRRHRILLRTELAPDLPPVAGDRVQLQQVILNLVLNGLEAMKEGAERPRELLIRSRLDETGAVLVAVHDTGVGLDPQNMERVFEAFYTTKLDGLGMGLAICRSIIEAHGGQLWASASEPWGAVFQFTLPADQDKTASAEQGSMRKCGAVW